MEQFTATGLSEELQKTPRGWSMDFQDQHTGEWWVAIRKSDMEELLDKAEHIEHEARPDEGEEDPTS